MKRPIVFAALLTLLATSGCTDGTDAIRSIRATVTTTSGVPVANATVKLYDSQTSWQNNGTVDYEATTDAGGVALFTNVREGAKWYVKTKGACHDSKGVTDYFTISGTFVNDHTIDVSVVAAEMGTLSVFNTNQDPYIIEVDNTVVGVCQSYQTLTVPSVAKGYHSITATQQSGYLLYPTVYDRGGNVTYCATTTVSF